MKPQNKSYQAYFVDVECLILRNTFEELDLWITLNPIFRSNVSTQIINAIKPKIWKTKTNYLANHNPQETRISNNINIEISRIQIWRSKYDLSPKIEIREYNWTPKSCRSPIECHENHRHGINEIGLVRATCELGGTKVCEKFYSRA